MKISNKSIKIFKYFYIKKLYTEIKWEVISIWFVIRQMTLSRLVSQEI